MRGQDMVKAGVMYAISFDLDTKALEASYGKPTATNAYAEIRKVLEGHGFNHTQGSLYFGEAGKINAVTCVLAIQDVTRRCAPWFAASVGDIRMLRIEDNNDLMPAVQAATAGAPAAARTQATPQVAAAATT